MSEFTGMVCPSCGKELPEAEGLSFCPFCASKLEVSSGSAAEGNYCRERMTITFIYESYDEWARKFLGSRNYSQNIISKLFSNKGDFQSSPKHSEFVRTLENYINDLSKKELSDTQLSEIIEYGLVDCHKDKLKETDWMFMAAEKFYSQFIDKLSTEAVKPLYEKYAEFRKKNKGFEIQADIMKKFKTRLGLKTSFFGK